jgi:hypothetical protein
LKFLEENMSENRHHPEVHSVSSASLAIVGLGAVLAGVAIYSLIRLLSCGAQKAYEELSSPISNKESIRTLKPVIEMAREFGVQSKRIVRGLGKYNLSQIESLKVSTLLSVANTPYMIENREAVLRPLESFIRATSLDSAEKEKNMVFHTLETNHQRVFMQTLVLACKQAAIKIGFDTVQTFSGPADSIRLVATDPAGLPSLVTEIRNTRAPELEYEVIGVTDGSCHGIMDTYNKALEAEGVRCAPPQRRFTGGVPYLAAAQEFLKRSVKPQTVSDVKRSKSVSSARRTQRLNQSRQVQICR